MDSPDQPLIPDDGYELVIQADNGSAVIAAAILEAARHVTGYPLNMTRFFEIAEELAEWQRTER